MQRLSGRGGLLKLPSFFENIPAATVFFFDRELEGGGQRLKIATRGT